MFFGTLTVIIVKTITIIGRVNITDSIFFPYKDADATYILHLNTAIVSTS